jgi:hypothetical protein
VEVFGFALGQPTRDTHPLHLTFANQEAPLLGDVLPDAERADIRGVGFPALDTQVLRLDGNLLPGHSGAPLIDNAGQVVGIGSGGLERGAVGVGWAVRAQYLQRLLQSADALPAGGTEAATAFATAAPATGASDKVTCGGMTLTLRRTLRLARIAASASDPHGLDHLADGLVQVKPGLLAANKFSIWTEPGSAAGVVIPSALPLEAGPDYCIVHAMAGPVRYLIRLVKLPQDRKDPAWAAQVRAEELRSAALIDDAVHARLAGDAGGAFRSRHWVQGALVVHRLFKGRAADGRSILVYRSDLAGRGAYILNAVIDDDAAAADPTARAKAAWARGVFAVHLTGFPPVEGVEPPSP